MNIAQKLARFVFPPPRSNGKPSHADLPPNEANNNRCEFTFSDGRRCRFPAKVYPQDELSPANEVQRASHCVHYGSGKEQESGPCAFSGPALEGLQTLCGDLTTAANINRALAHVFLLMAQGRIPQKQAVAFGYLSQLLLQTVPGIRSEHVSAHGYQSWQNRLKDSLTANSAESTHSSPYGGEGREGQKPLREANGQPSNGVVDHEKAVRRERHGHQEPRGGEEVITPLFAHKEDAAAHPAPSAQSAPETKATPPAPPAPDYGRIFRRSLNLLDRKSTIRSGLPAKVTNRMSFRRSTKSPRAHSVSEESAAAQASAVGPASALPATHDPALCSPRRGATGVPEARRPCVPWGGELALGPSPLVPSHSAAAKADRAGNFVAPSSQPEPRSGPPRQQRGAPTPKTQTAHTNDWYAAASWSRPRPDPFPNRQEKLNRKLRTMSDRRRQHQNQSRAFWC